MGHSLFKGGITNHNREQEQNIASRYESGKRRRERQRSTFWYTKSCLTWSSLSKAEGGTPSLPKKERIQQISIKLIILTPPMEEKKWPVTSFLSFTQCDIPCPKWTLWVKAKITGKYKIIILKSMCKAVKDTGSWETEGYIDNLIVYFVNVFLVPWRSSRAEEQYKDSQRTRQMLGLRNCSLREAKFLEFLGSIFRETPTHRKAEGYRSMCSFIDT